jgi:4-hydroxy-4-methyl-2-oxoglutarate aldolase
MAAGTRVRYGATSPAVVHGAVRDTDAIRELDFPVWATAISVEHPEKRGPAAVNVPIVVDGVLVEPGDIIRADADGVLVIPRGLLAHAVEGAEKRAAAEVTIRKRIADGELPFDIFGFRQIIADAGIEQKDCTWEEDS